MRTLSRRGLTSHRTHPVVPERAPLHQAEIVRHPDERPRVARQHHRVELQEDRVHPRRGHASAATSVRDNSALGQPEALVEELTLPLGHAASGVGSPAPAALPAPPDNRRSAPCQCPCSSPATRSPAPTCSTSPASSQTGLAERLESAYGREVRVFALDIPEREAMIWALDEAVDQGARRAPGGPVRGARRPGARRAGLARGVPAGCDSLELGIGRDDG